jgi:ribosomal protein L16 Arg81 hydroxylase
VGTTQRPFHRQTIQTSYLKRHWTLLVQAVDHYFPELAVYWQAFSFIPTLATDDDVMISYAATRRLGG